MATRNIIPKRRGLKIVKKKLIPNNSNIINLLENITNEKNKDDLEKNKTLIILNWLSYYFINMESSGTALLLDGNKEFSQNLFWSKIIQPIFGYEYTITIDDEILKHKVEEIVHEKVFYHIGDFEPTKENILKVNQLLQAVLIDRYLLINGLKPKKIPVYGQVLITAKESILLLKKYIKQFEYINIQDEDNSILDLQLPTDNDLDRFATILSSFYNKSEPPSIMNSMDLLEKADETSALENFDVLIEQFIKAFKDQDIEYFDKLKEIGDGKLYNELKDALLKEEGFYIKQDLSKYFNVIYNESIGQDKLFEILKDKDDMFKQEIDPLKATNEEDEIIKIFDAVSTENFIVSKKKICKITNYKLAQNIIVPNGFILKSVSKKNRFNYQYENEELAKKMYEKYDKLEQEKKQNSK